MISCSGNSSAIGDQQLAVGDQQMAVDYRELAVSAPLLALDCVNIVNYDNVFLLSVQLRITMLYGKSKWYIFFEKNLLELHF